MRTVGLFSGIGGLEQPLSARGAKTALLCEWWDPARAVLRRRFPDVDIHRDILTLKRLPVDTELVTAGFPCTDLSQAGRTAGIGGKASGLVAAVFDLLRRCRVETLVLENVRNMLVLDGGQSMFYLTDSLERLGYRWAYRLVDSRFTGVPQRRHRVILVAMRDGDPRRVLFADEATVPDPDSRRFRGDAFGFYWTEGLTGVGWARDAVPPLKGGSGLGIPSPPGIWLPEECLGERLRTPSIEAAERLQGFPAGWTTAAERDGKRTDRWKLVGNAVSTGVGDWIARRLQAPADQHPEIREGEFRPKSELGRWPDAAYGRRRRIAGRLAGHVAPIAASQWPERARAIHLADLIERHGSALLSERATNGFLNRARRSRLHFEPRFIADLEAHSAEHQLRRERSDLVDAMLA